MEKYKNDFQLWCRECVTITDKQTGLPVPFILNAPQQRVLATIEQQRRNRQPIRLIMLKARQWGGSTLIQIYMAWMQLVQRCGWNSIVCAHFKDASAVIRGIYTRLLADYPDTLKTPDTAAWTLTPYEKSRDICQIPARQCRITLATAASPNALRGGNYAMAHLSEVAFWADGDRQTAEQTVRTICGSIINSADTMIVMESTANGKDNYFYDEWQRAVNSQSDKQPIFVPWHEIEIYRQPLTKQQKQHLLDTLDDYERKLYNAAIDLEHIAWYHNKRREYPTHQAMMAEFPTTPDEAFAASTQTPLLTTDQLNRIKHTATTPTTPPTLSAITDNTITLAWKIDNTITLADAPQTPIHTLPRTIARTTARRCPITNNPTSADNHSLWLDTALQTLNIDTITTADNPLLSIDTATATCLADNLRQTLTDNKTTIIETNPEQTTHLAEATQPLNPARLKPSTINRLTLIQHLTDRNDTPLNPAEFIQPINNY